MATRIPEQYLLTRWRVRSKLVVDGVTVRTGSTWVHTEKERDAEVARLKKANRFDHVDEERYELKERLVVVFPAGRQAQGSLTRAVGTFHRRRLADRYAARVGGIVLALEQRHEGLKERRAS